MHISIRQPTLCPKPTPLSFAKIHQSLTVAAAMASMTMTASFLGVPSATKQHHPSTARRSVTLVRASMDSNKTVAADGNTKEEGSNNTRRDLMFAAAAAAACAVARVAMADEPKRGTTEARKKYAPICVTMPTARVCHN